MHDSAHLQTSLDAAYRFFSMTTLVRARRLPRNVVKQRAEDTFIDLCDSVAPTVTVEVGAHEGTFSRIMKEHWPGATCVAFEANPHVYEKYDAALTELGVDYRHLAISEVDGTVDLSIPTLLKDRPRPLTNRVASLGRHRKLQDSETATVPSRPLDLALPLTDEDRVVAWIDVEGANETVLKSGRDVLSRTSLVFIEVESETTWHDQWLDLDVHRFFAEIGMVPLFRDVQKQARRHQHNVAYARPEIAAERSTARKANRIFRPADKP